MQGEGDSTHPAADSRSDADIRVAEVLTAMRDQRHRALIVAAVIFAAMSLAVFLDRPIYRAYVTLAPSAPLVEPDQLSLADGLLGLGLGAQPGVDVSRNRTSRNEAFAMLNSRSMSRLFIQSEELMPILFAEKWDAAAE